MLKYSWQHHQELILGTKKAIAWGASTDAFLKIKKAPYQFECIVDKNAVFNHSLNAILNIPIVSPESLLLKNNQEYVVVIFADMASFAENILEDINKIGTFLVVPPFCPWKQFGQKYMMNEFNQFVKPFHTMREQSGFQRKPISKITLFINRLSRGGAEKQMVMLAVALANQGYKVCLVTVKPDVNGVEDWCKLLQESGVGRSKIPAIDEGLESVNSTLYDQLSPLFSSYAVYLVSQLLSLLLANKPDTLIAYMPGNCLIAGLAGILANIERISLSFRNIAPIAPSQDEYCYSTLAVAKDAMPLVLKKMLNLPGVSITHNSAVGRTSFASWMQLSEKVMQVVNNGMLAPNFGDIDVKKRHHINEQSTVLVGVMRLVAQKRPLLFLNCVNELRNRIPHLIVFLLGDGPLKLDVVEHIVKLDLQDIVTLVGNYQTPADYLNIADLLLHTAEFEGFPNVLLEAQALGCPVVATDVGGTSEVFSDELKELCLPVSDTVFALSDKVIEVLKPENKATYKAHSLGVLNRFSLDTLANETIKACIEAEE